MPAKRRLTALETNRDDRVRPLTVLEGPHLWRDWQRWYDAGEQRLSRRAVALRIAVLLLIRDHGPLYCDEARQLGNQLVCAIVLSLRDRWWCDDHLAALMAKQILDQWHAELRHCVYLGLIQRTTDNEGYSQYLTTRAGDTWIERYLPRWNECPITAFGGLLTV